MYEGCPPGHAAFFIKNVPIILGNGNPQDFRKIAQEFVVDGNGKMIQVIISPCHIEGQGAAFDQFADIEKGTEGEPLAVSPVEAAVPGSFDIQRTAGPPAHGDGHINHPEFFPRA